MAEGNNNKKPRLDEVPSTSGPDVTERKYYGVNLLQYSFDPKNVPDDKKFRLGTKASEFAEIVSIPTC